MDARPLAALARLIDLAHPPDLPEDPWPPIVEIVSIERTQEP